MTTTRISLLPMENHNEVEDDYSFGKESLAVDSMDWCNETVGSLISLADTQCLSLVSHGGADDDDDSSTSTISADWMHTCTAEEHHKKNAPTNKIKVEVIHCMDHEESSLSTISSDDESGWNDNTYWNGASGAFQISTPLDGLTIITDAKPSVLYDTTSTKTVTKTMVSLSSLPNDILCEMLSYLNVNSLLQVRLLSQQFQELGSRDSSGWSNHCQRLWNHKVHVSWKAMKASEEGSALSAYRISCQDGLDRQEITSSELCYDLVRGKGTIWSFRFKESAGSAWTSFDPWHAGLEARKMVFLLDGSVQEVLPPLEDESASSPDGGQSASLRLRNPFSDAPNQQQIGPNGMPLAPPILMKWRFLLQPMDMPLRPRGAYIRLQVGGREVPTYIIRRSPTGNWGFVMENCWAIFASFPLPRRQDITNRADAAVEGRPPRRPVRLRLRRTSTGGVRWLNVDGMESDDEDNMEETSPSNPLGDLQSNGNGRLLSDRALPTTSRRQWREALLYNYGAVSLPEGETARDEFDRIFEDFRSPIRWLDRL